MECDYDCHNHALFEECGWKERELFPFHGKHMPMSRKIRLSTEGFNYQ